MTYTTSTEAELFDRGLFYTPTGVTYADASLPVAVTRGSVVVWHVAEYEIVSEKGCAKAGRAGG